MKYGFGRTAVQMACTLLALCLGIGLLRQERMRTVFSEERVTLPIIMYHSILKDGARQENMWSRPRCSRATSMRSGARLRDGDGTRTSSRTQGTARRSRQSRSC